jgi:hypothetical protein
MTIAELRRQYHQQVCTQIIRTKSIEKSRLEYPSFADAANRNSLKIAKRMLELLGCQPGQQDNEDKRSIQELFEELTEDFLKQAFDLLDPLRPGTWYLTRQFELADFHQYAHLAEHTAALDRARRTDEDLVDVLRRLIGPDYIVAPDIVVYRMPLDDATINQAGAPILDPKEEVAKLTPLRKVNSLSPRGILHASISCKWTVRSDRAQNTRTEALNLIRNRKGNLPHIAAITAEPLPTRIASLALGTGDLDCVYHFALLELQQAVQDVHAQDQQEVLNELIQGRRLRDIADLPFDLAI